MPAGSILSGLISCLMLCLLSVEVANAEIYTWKDGQGVIHYTDQKPEHVQAHRMQLNINSYESVSYEKTPGNENRMVLMYSTSWCGYCKKARRYFTNRGIEYSEYDIEKNAVARRQYKNLGGRGVPVILVGDQRMNGFSEQGFERLYP